jgi:hypothetical protein
MDFTENDNWFVIKNLDGLINSSRALVFNHFGNSESDSGVDLEIDNTDKDELDSVLSFNEAKIIILGLLKKQKNKKTKQIRYLMNNALYHLIISSLNDRMVSNILQGLVSKGLVETAYDDNVDDFVFWIKENKLEK